MMLIWTLKMQQLAEQRTQVGNAHLIIEGSLGSNVPESSRVTTSKPVELNLLGNVSGTI
jgi:hypothetical protein